MSNRKSSPKVPGENEAERVLHVLRASTEPAMHDEAIANRTGGSIAHVQNVLCRMVRQGVLVERTAPRMYRLKQETIPKEREVTAVVMLGRIAAALEAVPCDEGVRTDLGALTSACLQRVDKLRDDANALWPVREALGVELESPTLIAYIAGLPRRLDEAQYERHALLAHLAMALDVPCPPEPPGDDEQPDDRTLQLCVAEIVRLKARSEQLAEMTRRHREVVDENGRLLKAIRIIENALELTQK